VHISTWLQAVGLSMRPRYFPAKNLVGIGDVIKELPLHGPRWTDQLVMSSKMHLPACAG
jgi:hypothetical protein